MPTPYSRLWMGKMGRRGEPTQAWPWLLCLLLVLLVSSCGTRPNRLETLQHKKEVLTIRKDKDRFFKTSPNSPLLTEQQMNFNELQYFPVDMTYKVAARYQRLTTPIEFTIQTSTGHERVYATIGRFDFSLANKNYTLFAYQEKGQEPPGSGSLFVPFTDQTTGQETYGAGRYLDLPEPVSEAAFLDFNLAYNPYCAYNYNFSCPIPPPENRLEVAIKAGEKVFPLGQPLKQ